ncbi:hypothetical protein SUGI_1514730 [Cryptomeria japonica]|uniref:Uncharacterized protein n=1 Tax=Cryptomeria japonica TaxID=3369 RepID=A0AAD3RRT0_CRYJA|nr:hypothetical protein SUGI_0411990 [Cryptomeria japonica]GLJ21996.1 hypothetical protein SUGI_0412030 [Cryptomeria japonica]GLJ21999.1 hypothetical protein SUGI_0412120 [Cryptomeria japonica]GLJ59576.1 hypothetical protein SUGI_1514730 [Cryptomeria japonica]
MGRCSAVIVLVMLVLFFRSDCRLLDSVNKYEGKMGVKEKMKKRTDEKAGTFYPREELQWIHSPDEHCLDPC